MLPPYLSASRISTWLICPQKYKLQYEDKVQWLFYPSAMLLGTSIHNVLECFYREWLEGRHLPLEKVQSLYSDFWKSEIDGKKLDTDSPDDIKAVGLELLAAFHTSVQPRDVIAVEEDFRVPIVHPETGEILPVDLVGRIDLIESDDQGQPVIVDHKCLSKRPSDIDMKYNIQLWAYAYAARMRDDIPDNDNVLLRIDAMVKLKRPVFDQRYTVRSPESDVQFFELASGVYSAITSGVFPLRPGWWCKGCSFAYTCIMQKTTKILENQYECA
jgi:RecB family exonuclease